MSALPVIACCRPLGGAHALRRGGRGDLAAVQGARRPGASEDPQPARDGDAPVCVCELIAPLGLSQPTVSHHLKKLTEAGPAPREQRGVWAYYSIDPDAVAQLRRGRRPEWRTTMNLELREAGAAALRRRSDGRHRRLHRLSARPPILSLGSGDPLAVAGLRAGERVLDLGSGGGPRRDPRGAAGRPDGHRSGAST